MEDQCEACEVFVIRRDEGAENFSNQHPARPRRGDGDGDGDFGLTERGIGCPGRAGEHARPVPERAIQSGKKPLGRGAQSEGER